MGNKGVNNTRPFAVVIMAAGKGTRLKSGRAKVLHEIGGRPLLSHVIAAASQVVAAKDIHVIIGHQAEEVRAAVAGTGVHFVLQSPQRGTGHAVMCARKQVQDYDNILVLSGDAPLIGPETIARLRDFHLARKAAMTILSAEVAEPFGYGRVVRRSKSSDAVKAIIEQKQLSPQQHRNLREINSSIYAFSTKPLFANLDRLSTDNPHGEFYLTDMAAILVKTGASVLALRTADAGEILGANTLAELAQLDGAVRLRKCQELMAAGVSIYRPDTCQIDSQVEVAADTIIEPFVQLLGHTRIGTGCRIRSYSIVGDSQIGDNVLIRPHCFVNNAQIASGAMIGPFTHLRPESEIGAEAHIGNFVEVKKSKVGRRAKANHLAYLGDAEIGNEVNIGAGTITCNFDGRNKNATVVEDGAFIGSDTTLVAPVRVGKGAYVGAGSTITDDVPPGALAVGRGRQVVKEGWVAKRGQKAKEK